MRASSSSFRMSSSRTCDRPVHAVHDEFRKALPVDEACLEPLADLALDVSPATPGHSRGPHRIRDRRQGAPVPFSAILVLASEEPGLFTAVSALHQKAYLLHR